jgi:hypothetical protein
MPGASLIARVSGSGEPVVLAPLHLLGGSEILPASSSRVLGILLRQGRSGPLRTGMLPNVLRRLARLTLDLLGGVTAPVLDMLRGILGRLA